MQAPGTAHAHGSSQSQIAAQNCKGIRLMLMVCNTAGQGEPHGMSILRLFLVDMWVCSAHDRQDTSNEEIACHFCPQTSQPLRIAHSSNLLGVRKGAKTLIKSSATAVRLIKCSHDWLVSRETHQGGWAADLLALTVVLGTVAWAHELVLVLQIHTTPGYLTNTQDRFIMFVPM